MRVVSWFAGIGGFDAAFVAAGHRIVGACEIDEAARKVYAARFGEPAWFPRDIAAVTPDEIPDADIWVGGFPCFPAGTLVLTRDGYVAIDHICVGTEVYTHAGRWRRVTATMTRDASRTVTLSGGAHFGLTTTDEHPFWSSGGRRRMYKPARQRRRGNWFDLSFGHPEWAPAKRMMGRYWAAPILAGTATPPPVHHVPQADGAGAGSRGVEMTPDLLWFVGAWVGDGWLRRRKARGGNLSGLVICSPHSEMPELLDRITRAGLRATVVKERTVDKLFVSSRALALWLLANFGEYSYGKRLPGWLYECSDEYRRAFLDGYLWADGCWKDDAWNATTVSRALAIGIVTLGHSLGFVCAMYHSAMPPTCVIEGRRCSQRDQYSITGKPVRKQTHAFRVDRWAFSRVNRAVDSGPARVFNISVEEDESYVAEGIVVHNCQDVSVAGARAGAAEGTRSGLWWTWQRLMAVRRPPIIVAENVPGLLSVNGRVDFAAIVDSLWKIGYLVSVEEFDARDFGVAQRRRRLFFTCVLAEPGQLKTTHFFDVKRIEFAMRFLRVALARASPPCGTDVDVSAYRRDISGDGIRRILACSSAWPEPSHFQNWLDGCDAALPLCRSAPVVSESAHGHGPSPTDTEPDNLEDLGSASIASGSISKSWRESWVGLCESQRSSTTSTATSWTIDRRIFTYAETVLLISSRIAVSTHSCPCCYDAAASALIAVAECTSRLRAMPSLFVDPSDRMRRETLLTALSIELLRLLATVPVRSYERRAASLADTLERDAVHPRFYLSPKACAGILRRAARRGRDLPTALAAALTATAAGVGADARDDPKMFESRFARNGRGAPSDIVAALKAQAGADGRGDGSPLVMGFYPTAGTRSVEARDDESPALKVGSGVGIPSAPAVAFGGNRTSGPRDDATALSAHGGASGRLDFESETFIVAAPDEATALRARDVKASPDSDATQTLVVSALQAHGDGRGHRIDAEGAAGGQLVVGDPAPCLRAADGHHGRSSPRGDGSDALVVVEGDSAASTPNLPRLRAGCGHGDVQSGVPFVVHAAQSGAKARHAYESDHARCIDGTGGFASAQGGTVVASFGENLRGEVVLKDDAPALGTGGGKPGSGYAAVLAIESPGRKMSGGARTGDGVKSDEAYALDADPRVQGVAFVADASSTAYGVQPSSEVSPTLDVGKRVAVAGFNQKAESGKGGNGYEVGVAAPLRVENPGAVVAFSSKDHGADAGDESPTIRACPHDKSHANGGAPPAIHGAGAIRRLTASECERLQGGIDGWTCTCNVACMKPDDRMVPSWWPPDVAMGGCGHATCGCKCSDGPRYRMLGNSVAVPCVAWIARRLS